MNAVIYIRKVNTMDGKQRRILGQQWLYQAVAAFGVEGLHEGNCPVERTEKGKPFFPACPQIHFSISHSREYWACAVADHPVGLDLQYHKQGRLEGIPGRFFHPKEAAWLTAQGFECGGDRETVAKGSDAERIFFDIWAAKESYVKWTGQGIDRHFGEFSVVDEAGLVNSLGEAHFWRYSMEKYSLCLCGSEPWEHVLWKWIEQEEET